LSQNEIIFTRWEIDLFPLDKNNANQKLDVLGNKSNFFVIFLVKMGHPEAQGAQGQVKEAVGSW
jgi:hypothetical protein